MVVVLLLLAAVVALRKHLPVLVTSSLQVEPVLAPPLLAPPLLPC